MENERALDKAAADILTAVNSNAGYLKGVQLIHTLNVLQEALIIAKGQHSAGRASKFAGSPQAMGKIAGKVNKYIQLFFTSKRKTHHTAGAKAIGASIAILVKNSNYKELTKKSSKLPWKESVSGNLLHAQMKGLHEALVRTPSSD